MSRSASLLRAVFFTLAVSLPAVSLAGNTYYVSSGVGAGAQTAGNDTGPGTLAEPWQTLWKGVTTMQGGDTLVLRGGEYDTVNGLVDGGGNDSIIPSGASWSNVTKIMSYPGEKAVMRRYMPSNWATHFPGATTIEQAEETYRNSWHLPTYEDCDITQNVDGLDYYLDAGYPYSCWTDGAPPGLQEQTQYLGAGPQGYVLQLWNHPEAPVQYVVFDGVDMDARGICDAVTVWEGSMYIRFQNLEIRNSIHSGVSEPNPDPGHESWQNHIEWINCKIHSVGVPYDTNEVYGVLARKNSFYRFRHPWYSRMGGKSLINSEFYNSGGTGLGPEGADNVIIGNYIHDNNAQGIYIAGGDNWIITNNVLRDNGVSELYYMNSTGHLIANNTCIAPSADNPHPAWWGVTLHTESYGDTTHIENNIIYGFQVALYNMTIYGPPTYTVPIFRNNLLYGNATNYFESYAAAPVTKVNNILDEDPLFIDPANGDYRLQAGSPAIDAGYANGLTYDFDGTTRPFGAGIDIGAFEFSGNTYNLSVQSTPPTGLSISSTSGQSGTTNYVKVVSQGRTTNLQAPSAEPSGYVFYRWTLNGTAQTAGQKSLDFTIDANSVAVALYNAGYNLTVQSTPITGVAIASSTGNDGATNFVTPIASGSSVNLEAPAGDPAGHTFSRWTLNGTAQTAGAKTLGFTMSAARTAVAEYTVNSYSISVESTSVTGVLISSTSGDGGSTNYITTADYGTNVNLQAPATDPTDYNFARWSLNGTFQTAGQKSLTFTVSGNATAVAEYDLNGTYTLTVMTTPPTGLSIGSSSGHSGVSNYTVSAIDWGTSVTLQAPATDPAGYVFARWSINGTAQTLAEKAVTFEMRAAATAIAQYVAAGSHALSVQSTPAAGVSIGSSSGHGGTTNYTMAVNNGALVTLQAAAVSGSAAFSTWILNDVEQTAGQQTFAFMMNGDMTAVAKYNASYYVSSGVNSGGVAAGSDSNPGTLAQPFLTVQHGLSVMQPGDALILRAGDYDTANGLADGDDSLIPSGTSWNNATTLRAYSGERPVFRRYMQQGASVDEATYRASWHYPTLLECQTAGYGSNYPYSCWVNSSNGLSVQSDYLGQGATGYVLQFWNDPAAPVQYVIIDGIDIDARGIIDNALAFWSGSLHIRLQNLEIRNSIKSMTTQPGISDIAQRTDIQFVNVTLHGAGAPYDTSTVDGVLSRKHPAANFFQGIFLWTSSNALIGSEIYDCAGIAASPYANDNVICGNYIHDNNNNAVYIEGGDGWQIVNNVFYNNGSAEISHASGANHAVSNNTIVAGPAGSPCLPERGILLGAAADSSVYQNNIVSGFATGVRNECTQSNASTFRNNLIKCTTTDHEIFNASGGVTSVIQQNNIFGQDPLLKDVATSDFALQQGSPAIDAGYSSGLTTDRLGASRPQGSGVDIGAYEFAPGGPTTHNLFVQSTPVAGVSISSSTAHSGTTNYTKFAIEEGTSINLHAPATDPAGYTFSQWTIGGTAQTAGQKTVNFTMSAATTAVAVYTENSYTLTVQSTPATGVVVGSSTSHNGTTNYTKTGIVTGASVNLQAPTTDPTGYTFSNWTLGGTAQTSGQKSLSFTMTASVTAAAVYTQNSYTLTIQSTPVTGVAIASSTGHDGATNYSKTAVAHGTSINLQAPATDPSGYTFSRWTLGGTAQAAGQKSLAFALNAAATAVAQYSANSYTLSVQSTPVTGVAISSSTSHGGTTNYTKTSVAHGTSVNLQAPSTDPTGYTFSRWTLGGTGQTSGQKTLSFTLTAALTAVAEYDVNVVTLTVQSTPIIGVAINSGTGHGGTTNYTKSDVPQGSSVNLQVSSIDPTGYAFTRWTLNGTVQTAGQKSVTFTINSSATAVAQYSVVAFTLTVQSTSVSGVAMASSTGHDGTTNYTKTGVMQGASVNLQSPATDPSGYVFSRWTLGGTAQTAGQKSVTFNMNVATTAVAEYNLITYTLTVQSTPHASVTITSSTTHGGTTNYTKTILPATSVNLQATTNDPSGYVFFRWTLNGTAQTDGQKWVNFSMSGDTTAVAEYRAALTLTVQSTPPTGLAISSTTSHAGTTNYTETNIPQGATVNLQAPVADPPGYSFSCWTIGGTAQTSGQKTINFNIDSSTTAAAVYSQNNFTLTVQSTPVSGILVGSSTGHDGTTNCVKSEIAPGTGVNLQAPATDPAQYLFLRWSVNGTAQSAGQKSLNLTMYCNTTAVAVYGGSCTLTVNSSPGQGITIPSSTGHGGQTNYDVSVGTAGTVVNLQAPASDSQGRVFTRWLLNDTNQPMGQSSLNIAVTETSTATAQYSSPGAVWTFGLNSWGQLGDGTKTQRLVPIMTHVLSSATRVAGGAYHTLALTSGGTVYAYGRNADGQLGNGARREGLTPVQVSSLTDIVVIAAGDSHSLAVDSSGRVWAWGMNKSGQLGDGTKISKTTPVMVSGLSGVTIVSVAAGLSHSLALDDLGRVWAWGGNDRGQIGASLGKGKTTLTPILTTGLTGVTAIAAGSQHSIALKSDGTLMAWGANDWGQLGNGGRTDAFVPVAVLTLTGVIEIAAGGSHSLAIRNGGSVWAWGSNSWGQLGNSCKFCAKRPAQVAGIQNAAGIAGGMYHTVIRTSTGEVWTMGWNGHGELGDGTRNSRCTPLPLGSLSGIAQIGAGGWHTIVMRNAD